MTEIINGVSGAEGGFGVFLLGLLGWLGKQYLDSRKDKREDQAAERSTESGIVETTTATLATVRKELDRLSAAREADAERIEMLKDKVEDLESENYRMRRRLEELENGSGGWSARDSGATRSPATGGSPPDARGLDWRGPAETQPGPRIGEGGRRARRRYRDAGPEDSAGGPA